MSMEENHFDLLRQPNAGEEIFLNSYIVFLRAVLTCTVKSSLIGQWAGAIQQVAPKEDVKIHMSPAFSYQNMICLYNFRAIVLW